MFRPTFAVRFAFFCLLFATCTLLPFFAHHAAAQCSPPACYPPPPDNPPPSAGGDGSWAGYSDGRLNPDMAEYYTVYCRNDQIEVWGGVPSPQLINSIPMVNVLVLGDVGSFDAGNGLTVSRTGATVVISGSNGNGPGPSSKWFSLNECIARNGGAPELPQANPQQQQPAPPDDSPSAPADAEDATDDVQLCLPGAQSTEDFLRCLNFFAPDTPSATYLYVVNWAIITFCSGGMAPIALVASVPAIRLWRRRRKR